MTPRERVLGLIRTGTIAPAEGARLLAALSAEPGGSRLLLLVNPFERFGGGTAALVGLAGSVLALCATRLGVRFDGFLDLHVSRANVPTLWASLLEQGIAWILPALCFWGYARVFARHVRPLDFVGMVGLARLPMVVAALPIALLAPDSSSAPASATPGLVATALLALSALAWTITLHYQGFKNASGLRGAKLVAGFVAMIVVAEALSKAALAALP